ncbi:glycosyltransferase family 2 protein [Brasilonema sp. UFV-L1]|uniref:glycosyltransferase family 2 protein n=1 Tax=Brasilonema sp. UFV-L1 TaxID=2234130 RepID=UPI00145C87A0|nr:glycosyltransferase family 2 protein [Brasilonema sp. UFV-L1]NMG11027.1 glycosyltransferase [Brasilonema sp. UFV-L1]
MKRYPKISIVTPSYNQGHFIELAIQSVLEQNYQNFEHIILDNCSTDQTLKVLKKYDHLTWISEPDKGQSDALNKGFRMATGDIIGWLNADDKYLPGCFQKIANCFAEYPESDIAYGDYRWVNEKGDVFQSRREIDFDPFILKYLHILYIPSTSTFFKRRIFDEGNFLDTSLKYAMDYEFFLRLEHKKYNFIHVNSYLADFRWHTDNKSVTALDKQIDELEIALLRHDDFLRKVPASARSLFREILKLMARTKRYLLKATKGYYFNQWQRHALD